MTYATQQDLIDRFGSDELIALTDRANVGSIDATVVARALADADAEINGYISSQYVLPLQTVPAMVIRIACDIARYQLSDERATETVRNRYKDSVMLLKNISTGAVQLGVATGQPATEPNGGSVAITSPGRVFNRTTLSDF